MHAGLFPDDSGDQRCRPGTEADDHLLGAQAAGSKSQRGKFADKGSLNGLKRRLVKPVQNKNKKECDPALRSYNPDADRCPEKKGQVDDSFPSDEVGQPAERIGQERGCRREDQIQHRDERHPEAHTFRVDEQNGIAESSQGEDGAQKNIQAEVPVDFMEGDPTIPGDGFWDDVAYFWQYDNHGNKLVKLRFYLDE